MRVSGNELELGCSKYYYQNKDMVTTCLLTSKTGKVIARGVAICNTATDEIDKAEGRHWAKRRAVRALMGRKGDIPIKDSKGYTIRNKDTIVRRPEIKEIINGTGFTKKSYVNPKLTQLERQLLPHI